MWKTLLAQFSGPSCDIMSHNWDFLMTVKPGSLNLKSGSSLDEDNFYCANITSVELMVEIKIWLSISLIEQTALSASFVDSVIHRNQAFVSRRIFIRRTSY